ncbi:hypothetical protein TVAG_252240 [Trichomonas vaginalis G3]|uniref:Uncharacterized protein n=1 Tax=Trichomonas vaginalis (strain ATCC PRA-98 / G3) TaxID=412133 RepID=A2DVW6_TRIV3|nr:hypothetical protein TVAGG3_0846130 [Trichomonas vaginalis G3]EAY15411.1 hypothetical protein TVAG_252240 [Trichomonas vaginalis G3]KAI5499625.1 hypothetical protein TVAGG3_0846130 [Trichomonas vaginalis G3]|eukprot:XP_001327634.1 hypothetical protein [Trichomonas vaginalis G3]
MKVKSSSEMKFSLANETNQTDSGMIEGQIVMGSPLFEEGKNYDETKFDISILSLSNTDTDTSLFNDDIIYEIPADVKTEKEVYNYSASSDVSVVRDNNYEEYEEEEKEEETTEDGGSGSDSPFASMFENPTMMVGALVIIGAAVVVYFSSCMCGIVWCCLKSKKKSQDAEQNEEMLAQEEEVA